MCCQKGQIVKGKICQNVFVLTKVSTGGFPGQPAGRSVAGGSDTVLRPRQALLCRPGDTTSPSSCRKGQRSLKFHLLQKYNKI